MNPSLRSVTQTCLLLWLVALTCVIPLVAAGGEKQNGSPLKVLFLTGGGYHDYQKLAPFLTTNISQRINAKFDIAFDLDRLKNENFAEGYDVIVHDFCFDEIDQPLLDNALKATRSGKPTVLIHCAVHAFRKSSQIREWENLCGMRSKVHDPYQSFVTEKISPENSITKNFPSSWKTPGDELYQTIEMIQDAKPLLRAKSPSDGREHIVCWSQMYGKGRVFATTLGHDMKTVQSADYLDLVSRGILWSCGKLGE